MRRPLSKGEIFPHKVAAVFADAGAARAAADAVRGELQLAADQVRVITPDTRRPGRKMEPESHGIWSVLVKAHVWLGLAGVAAGLLLFGVLYAMDVPWITSDPWSGLRAIVFFMGLGGLMLGGLATLRPTHDAFIMTVLDACREGRCAVIGHATTREQRDALRDAMQGQSGEIVATL